MKTPILAGIIFVAVFVAVLLYSTISLARNRYTVEVCMQYEGRTNCSVSSGRSRDTALRAATTSACAVIAGGVTGSQQCEHAQPVSVKWRE